MSVSGFFIFFMLFIVGTAVFAGWVIVTIVRLMASAASNLFSPDRPGAAQPTRELPQDTVRCSNGGCLAQNPSDARFCRRCGHGLPAAARVQVRRAAVW